MKKTTFIILIFLLPTLVFAQWVKGFGGTSDDAGSSIAVDGSGNTYITGHFESTVDFDSGDDVFNLTSFGSFDIFLVKYDSDGSFVWAKNIGGSYDDAGSSITVDEIGNIYVTGGFEGTVDFDPGGSTFKLKSFGGADIFMAKYASDGSFIWAKSIGSSSYDAGSSIHVDGSGNIYITGYFEDTADFDPGSETVTLTSRGSVDIFIAKYTSDGSFVWAKSVGSTSDDAGTNISVDDYGNIYVFGFFEGTADFDPGVGTFNLINAGFFDIFISKYAPNGSFIWAKSVGGTYYDIGRGYADGSGNIYMTGAYAGTVDFDPGSDVFNLTSAGKADVFIAKYSTDGNFVWAKNLAGSANGEGTSISFDANEDIYITGAYEETVDFDPGNGVFNLTSAGQADVFIAKYSSDGNFIWAKSLGGAGDDVGYSIVLDGIGNSYATGNFQGNANFDLGTGISNITSAGDYDIFVVKYLSDETVSVENDLELQNEFALFQNYPNPFNPTTTISFSIPDVGTSHDLSVRINVFNVLGEEVTELVNNNLQAGYHSVEFNANNLNSGVYFYKIEAGNFVQIRKMMLLK